MVRGVYRFLIHSSWGEKKKQKITALLTLGMCIGDENSVGKRVGILAEFGSRILEDYLVKFHCPLTVGEQRGI